MTHKPNRLAPAMLSRDMECLLHGSRGIAADMNLRKKLKRVAI